MTEMTEHVLFKFRKIDTFAIKSIVHSELYFARPERLNDPFDCRVDIITALENAILKSESPSRQRLEKLRVMDSFFRKVQTDLASKGVCSFSLELLNPLLWSHYADGHRGLCLTYSFPETFFNGNDLWTAQVEYGINLISDWFLQEAHQLNSFEEFGIPLIKKVLTVKAQPWEYEKEVRIIRKTEGLQSIDKSHLKQICFGLATPEADITLIRKLIDQGNYNVTICKVERSEESDIGLKVLEI
jgi:hypothetical protein